MSKTPDKVASLYTKATPSRHLKVKTGVTLKKKKKIYLRAPSELGELR